MKASETGDGVARDAQSRGKTTKSLWPITDRWHVQLLDRPVDDRLRGEQGPTVGIELVGKSELFGGKTVGEAMHPDLSVSPIGLEPDACFGQPRLRTDFIGRCSDAAASML